MARPFLQPNAAHNTTLCLGPLRALFEAGLLFGERVRRTRTPSGADIAAAIVSDVSDTEFRSGRAPRLTASP